MSTIWTDSKISESRCKELGIEPAPVRYEVDIELGKIYFDSTPKIAYQMNDKEKDVLQKAIKTSIKEYKYEHKGELSPYEQKVYNDSAQALINRVNAKSSSSIDKCDSAVSSSSAPVKEQAERQNTQRGKDR